MTKNLSAHERKKQVIDAAIRCLIERGYANFSVKDIAEEAGVSTGILYHYFENKDDIMVQVLKETFSRTDETVRRTVEAKPAAEDILKTYLQFVGKMVESDPLTYQISMNYLGQVMYSDSLRGVMSKFFGNMRRYSASTLGRIVDSGQKGVDGQRLQAISAVLIGASLGLGIQQLVDEDGVDLNLCTEVLYEMLTDGLFSEGRG